MRSYLIPFLLVCYLLAPDLTSAQDDSWQLGPFVKADEVNPFLEPLNTTEFLCPVRGEIVNWEEKDVFNPAALVRDGLVNLVYRAEDVDGVFLGTSRLGLTVSDDGLNFDRNFLTTPIFYPDNDKFNKWEWEGGCEDPRIVEDESGNFILTYTGFDGDLARLMIATSPDLLNWTKHGVALRNFTTGVPLYDLWSKAGSIVTRMEGERFVAARIENKYWMYWGDTSIFLAVSNDLIRWTPVTNEDGSLLEVIAPRPGYFDSDLCEPGPQAILRDDGILLIYNSRNKPGVDGGDPTIDPWTYSAGQVLFDPNDPSVVLKRAEKFFMTPDKPYEIDGQVDKVVFLEGLVYYKGKWFVYYGTADSKIAVAVYDPAS